ncbi:ARD/ARD' family domain-containing protein [Ditylenchus destructor]|uniref:Acireductone dioxygenase n=1 Tax=Ditylenchus destructor TaxID=166010 RepID=A0AAD4MIJ2_9BILA|nr:ARD/ARD' family domain-containing protein [Ditylenchus destructor]
MVKCWLLKDTDKITDTRLENHREPKQFVTGDDLRRFGVFISHVPVTDLESGLDKICEEGGYKWRDQIVVNRTDLENYEERVKDFWNEHFHPDKEVRYLASGSGYFDVRNEKEEWVRMLLEPGDLMVLPGGIYHRFSPTMEEACHVIRLYSEVPTWTRFYRSEGECHNTRMAAIRTGHSMRTS